MSDRLPLRVSDAILIEAINFYPGRRAVRDDDVARLAESMSKIGLKTPVTLRRADYEANSLSSTRPWDAEGISRRTWYRRRDVAQVCSDLAQVHDVRVAQVGVAQVYPAEAEVAQVPFAQAPCEQMVLAQVREAVAQVGPGPAIGFEAAHHAAIRPKGYSDAEWLAAIADARRLGYPAGHREGPG